MPFVTDLSLKPRLAKSAMHHYFEKIVDDVRYEILEKAQEPKAVREYRKKLERELYKEMEKRWNKLTKDQRKVCVTEWEGVKRIYQASEERRAKRREDRRAAGLPPIPRSK